MVAIVMGSGLGLVGASSSVLGSAGQLGNAGLGQGNEAITVNARTGNLLVQHQDELLVGRGPDVGVIRTYNSNASFDFDNNDDWQLSLYKKLGNLTGTVNTAGSTLRLTGGDGAQLIYTYVATQGQYINKDGGGAYDSLSYNSASNTWTATDGDSRRSETYGASPTTGEWRITGQSDLDGNALSYTYDANGLISQVSDANGETTKLVYDAASKRLNSIQVIANAVTTTRVRYTYDAAGRLSVVTTDLTPEDGSIADAKIFSTTYTYDGTSTRLASITNSDGSKVSFTYDASFRVKTVVDGAGKITGFTYNSGNTTVTDPLGQTSTLSYDAAGNLTRLQGPTGSGQDVSYAYNGNGDLSQLTDSRGNAVSYIYDSNGNLLRQQDAAGNVVERAYNGANQLVRETAYAVADPDAAGSGQASTPQVTYYVRDSKQHLRFTISPEGRVTEYRYNAQGLQTSSLVYSGTFDPKSLASWSQDFSVNTSGLQPATLPAAYVLTGGALQVTSTNQASANYPNLYGASLPLGTRWRAEVTTPAVLAPSLISIGVDSGTWATANYCRLRASFGNGTVSSDAYQGAAAVGHSLGAIKPSTTYVVEVVTESDGGATLYVYEKGKALASGYTDRCQFIAGQNAGLAMQTYQGPIAATGVLGSTASILVDNLSSQLLPREADLVSWLASQSKTGLQRTDTAYDARGLASSVTRFANTDATGAGVLDGSQSTTQYVYDSAGRLLQQIDPRGVASSGIANDYLTAYAYDGIGRTIRVTQYDAAGSTVGSGATRQTLTTFNDASSRIEISLANGLKRLSTFDQRGLLLSQVEQDGATVLSSQSYQYDADGQLRVLTDANGNKTYYLYDNAGRKVGEIDATGGLTEFIYDNAGLLTKSIRHSLRVSQSLIDALAADPASGTVTRSLLPNAMTGWSLGVDGSATNFSSGTNLNASWQLAGEPTLWLRQNGVEAISSYLTSGSLTVAAGKRYEVSAYTGAHRADASLAVVFYDAVGNKIGELAASGGVTTNAQSQVGGTALAGYKRLWGFVTAPAGAVSAKLIVRKAATVTGQADSYLFVTHAYFAEAAATQTVASPFDVRPAASANDPTSRAIYDAAGRLRFAIDARGYVTEKRYDGAGRLLSTLAYANPLNNVAGLDSLGREATPADILLLAAAPTSGQIGLQVNSTTDRVTRNLYDNDGLLRGTLDGEGYLTEYRYDAAGRLNQTIRYSTVTTATDRAAGPLATLIGSANAAPATNIVSYAYYNGLGQQIGSLDGEGYYTAYQYDVAGNLTRRTRYASRLVGTALAGTAPQVVATVPASLPSGGYVLSGTQDQASQTAWTAFGQLDSETAVDGTLSKYTYDALGNRLSTVVAAGAADSRTQQARYDKQGRLTQELSALGSQALAALGATPTQAQIDAVWSAYGTTYTYDAGGRRIKSTDANGNITLFFYDADNRLTYSVRRVRNPANAAEWVGEVSARQFNVLGQLTAEIRYAKRIAATPFATLSGGSEAQIKAANVLVADSASDSRSDYSYLLTGELTRSTVKLNATQNAVVDYYSNAFGERYAVRSALDAARTRQEWFSYDRRGLLVQDQRDVVWTSNSNATGATLSTVYDAFGRATSSTDANGVPSKTVYDKLGRQIQSTTASGSLNLVRSSTYDAFGRVLTQTDALGKVTTYGYAIDTATGKTTLTISTPEGIVTKVVSDRYGQTLTLVDGLGNETRNSYDANGRLASSKRWDKAANVETTLEIDSYDALGNLLSTTDANGNSVAYTYDAANRTLTRRLDPAGLNLTTTYSYDAKGQQISVIDPNGVVTQSSYDLAGRLIQIAIDPSGLNLRTQYAYDLAGNRISVVEGYGSATARTTQYSYDSLGRRTQTAVDPAGLNLLTTYAYDKNGNLVTRVDAAGTALARTTRYSYDTANRLVYVTDALGGVTKNDYDAEGRLLQSTAYANAISLGSLASNPTLAAVAALITADATRDRTTRHVYDKNGRERFTIDALGAVSESQYDANGNVVKRIQYANALQGSLALGSAPSVASSAPGSGAYVLSGAADRVTVYAYDAFNRLKSKMAASGTSIAQSESYAYDKVGNLVRHTDARGNQEWFAYDKANRQIRHIDQGGYVTDTAWNADGSRKSETRYVNAVTLNATDTLWAYAGHAANPVANADAVSGDRTTVYTYDKAGRTATRTDALGVITRYAYDSLGNLIDTTVADGTAAAVTLHREYDLAGRVVAETRAYGTTDASRTTYAYDAQGNQKTIVEAAGTAAARSTTQEFDLLGRKTAAVDGSGARTVSTYNRFGEIVKVTDALGNAGYFYNDALGRVTLQVDPEGAVSETRYDLLGNATESFKYANKLVGSASETTRPQILAAAGTGLYVVKNDAADQHQLVIYDVLGRKSETRTWWGPNAADYYSENFTYDGNDNVLTAKARNGATTTYEYNKLNQKTREVLPVSSKNANNVDTVVENRFAYDALGNLTSKTEAYGLPEQRITTYSYDKLNRQVKETGQAINTFDPVTQASTLVAPTTTRAYDDRGNVIEEIAANGARIQHAYDAQDREISRIDDAGATSSWTYDAVGNKSSFTNAKGSTWTYAYDAVGRQTEEHSPAVSVTRLSMVNGLPQSVTSSESVVTRTAYDAQGNIKTRTEAYGAPEARTTSYAYDKAGRQISVTYPPVGVYDAGLDTPLTNGIGNADLSRTESLKVLVTSTSYDTMGNATVSRDVGGNDSYKVYDNLGRVQYEIDASHYLTAYTYDGLGNRLSVTRYATALNFTNHPQAFTQSEIRQLIIVSDDDRTITNLYDAQGHITETRQAAVYNYDSSTGQYFTASPTTKNMYNGFGQVICQSSLKNPLTGEWINTYFYYDGQGRKSAEINALGYLTTYQYDVVGNLTQAVEYAAALPAGSWTAASYAVPVTTTPSSVNSADPAAAVSAIGFDRITQYAYDTLNRKTSESKRGVQYSEAAGTSGTQNRYGDQITRFSYDALGNLISTTDPAGATTYSYYDALGRVLAVAEPTRISEAGAAITMPALAVRSQYLDIGPIETVVTGSSADYATGLNIDTTSTFINMDWSDLGVWGAGAARVVVNYVYGFLNTKASKTLNLSAAEAAHGATMVFDNVVVKSIASVQLQKMINGAWVTVIDSTSDSTKDSVLIWDRPEQEGALVNLQYRAQGGDGIWSSGIVSTLGNCCYVDMGGVVADRYEYVLSYTRLGEGVPYARGSGVFTLDRGVSTGSRNVVADVVAPYLDIGPIETVVTGSSADYATGLNIDTTSTFINMDWSDLGVWGAGAARVVVNYVYGFLNTKASKTLNLSAAEAAHGATMVFDNVVVKSIASVQLQKMINGAWVTVIDTAGDLRSPRQLVLRGNTAGLNGLEIRNANGVLVGSCSLANNGLRAVAADIYSVDVSALSPGNYTYTPVGTASVLAGNFTIGAANCLQIQERSSFLDIGPFETVVTGSSADYATGLNIDTTSTFINMDWSDLGVWGAGAAQVVVNYVYGFLNTKASKTLNLSAAEAAHGATMVFDNVVVKSIASVQLQKMINGAWVTVIDSATDTQSTRLEFSSLPSTAASVSLEYRKQGDTGPYLVKPSSVVTKLGAGWFGVAYDDIANGDYEYRLTVKDANGALLDLSAMGGNAQGQVSGIMNVRRGAQSLPSTTSGGASLLTPLSKIDYDIFGNAVHQTRYSKGASAACDTSYAIAGLDAAGDQQTYNFYDGLGRSTKSFDAEGAATYFSYDAYGRVAKRWQPLIDNDGNTQNSVTLYSYDMLGHQTASTEIVNSTSQAKTEVKYNAFGEIIAKGLNGLFPEFVQYDRVGRVLRTNSDKGVTQAFLYNLQGQATASIKSQKIDLSATEYASSLAVKNLSQDIERTDTVYDVLGRAIRQIQPSLTG